MLIDDLANHLGHHTFQQLFIELLGWEYASGSLPLSIEERPFTFTVIAQKRGFQILHCPTHRLTIVNRGLLRKAQRLVAKSAHEHILIYSSDDPPRQVWQWAVRLPDGRRLHHREHPFFSNSPPPKLLRRLAGLEFRLDEEDELTLLDALHRVRQALDTTAELHLFVRRPKYAEQSDALAAAMQSGDAAARDRFVLFHRRLVRWVARRASKQFGIEVEDAEQIGMIGLLHAAERFDRSRGLQFSTYATYCIEGYCKRDAPPFAQLIRIPPHVYWPCVEVRAKLARSRLTSRAAGQAYLERLGQRDPIIAKRWMDFQRATACKSLSDRRQPEFRQARLLVDRNDGPFSCAIQSERIEAVRAVIGQLHARYAEVIRLRHGIEGPPQTLEQIGMVMRVTRERVRQLQVVAEARLKRLILAEIPGLIEGREECARSRDGNVEGDEEPTNAVNQS